MLITVAIVALVGFVAGVAFEKVFASRLAAKVAAALTEAARKL
mgnify:CR=1 FL=1